MINTDFLDQLPAIVTELPFVITFCDTEGVILYMNDRSIQTFEKYGGADIIGTSLFLYHPAPASEILRRLLDTREKYVYTIEKNGIKKLIYQSPWYKKEKYAGLIELSLEIPMEINHFIRQ